MVWGLGGRLGLGLGLWLFGLGLERLSVTWWMDGGSGGGGGVSGQCHCRYHLRAKFRNREEQ